MLTPGVVMMSKGSQKKIEEDYTMYEEVKDDELEDIIEEDIEDESDEYDQEKHGDTMNED
jgi:hypothetical protein